MDNRDDVSEFLATRRARLTPQDVGLPTHGANRRVKGLRREEVAVLAGVSIDYYTRLERGNLTGVSDSVLEAVARALQLDEAERAHLLDLARSANNTSTPRRRRPSEHQVRPGMQRLLDAMANAPTARAQRAPRRHRHQPARPGLAVTRLRRHVDTRRTWPASRSSTRTVASSSSTGTTSPTPPSPSSAPKPDATRRDRNLTDLIGELATRSDEFRTRWAAHNVRLHDHGTKRFHHPVVGDLALTFEELPLPADPGLTMTAYTAEPGTASHDALALLASWTLTPVVGTRSDQAQHDDRHPK